jgi:hypothetical protein
MTVKFAVSVTVPDTPVMVTVVAVGSGVEDPPQPVKRLSPITLTASRRIICRRRRFRKPKRQRATANVAPGNSGLELRRRLADVELSVTVSVDVAAVVPVVVTEEGEKLHVAPDGNPEQDKAIAEGSCAFGVMVTVIEPVV